MQAAGLPRYSPGSWLIALYPLKTTPPRTQVPWIKDTDRDDVDEWFHVVRGEPPTPLTVFRARDGRLFCVETGCPHAGHRLSNGHCLDPGDIEDLAPPGALGVLVSCPAHSYVYDTASGECVSAFGGGPGRAVVHATRVVDGVVQVDLEPAAGARALALDTETRNEIGMRCVEQALELKFGD